MIFAKKIFFSFAVVCLAVLALPADVQAIPPSLPSSFYGTVKINGANTPDGTMVEALINSQVVAQGSSQTYQGDSVYSLDVPGDDSSTTSLEGGREGDAIVFRIGGIMSNEQGAWHSAANVALNLTVDSETTLNTPMPTRTPLPTQTPIEIRKAANSTAKVSTTDVEATSTPIIEETEYLPDGVSNQAVIPAPLTSTPTHTPVPAEEAQVATVNLGNGGPGIVVIIIAAAAVVLAALFLVFVYFRSRTV